ncbi:hypothetical protein [Marinovum sp.]|uniref:hypothetical protein n=1 Tax=Marinovum sp. TaxID=2024839 RepID=UPI002B272669|nr:hypothetical protein [Marinovum sp.]
MAGLAAQHPFAASGPPDRDGGAAQAELLALFGPGDICGGPGAAHPDCDCCPLPGDIWPPRAEPVPLALALRRMRWQAQTDTLPARAPLRLGPIRGPPPLV